MKMLKIGTKQGLSGALEQLPSPRHQFKPLRSYSMLAAVAPALARPHGCCSGSPARAPACCSGGGLPAYARLKARVG